jgi:thioredoxin-related protein
MLHGAVFAQDWNTDLDTAKRKAAASNKNILLVFSGSDWCLPCMNMEKTVWQSAEFKAAAEKNWVLLRADFLQKKGDPEPVNVNDMKMILAEKYNRDGFFPYFVLLDRNGKVLGKNGYEEFPTAAEYVALFRKLGKN